MKRRYRHLLLTLCCPRLALQTPTNATTAARIPNVIRAGRPTHRLAHGVAV